MVSLSFQKKLTASMVLLSLSGMMVCGGASYFFLRRVLKDQINQSLEVRLDSVQMAIQSSLSIVT